MSEDPDGYAVARAEGARRVDQLIEAVADLLGLDS